MKRNALILLTVRSYLNSRRDGGLIPPLCAEGDQATDRRADERAGKRDSIKQLRKAAGWENAQLLKILAQI